MIWHSLSETASFQQTHGNLVLFNSESGLRFVLQLIVDVSIRNIPICSKINQNKFIICIWNSHQYKTAEASVVVEEKPTP
jgi:hypothetical protein